MIAIAPSLPGLTFTRAERKPEPSPLRSDVAGFVGRTRRGPIGELVRVEGWREYLRIFGGLDSGADTPYALRGYFENGGQVAYVVRLGNNGSAPTPTRALITFDVKRPSGLSVLSDPPAGFQYRMFDIVASSPGAWANRTRVNVQYRLRGVSDSPEVDIAIDAPDEPTEYLAGMPLNNNLEGEIERRSHLIRLFPKSPISIVTKTGPTRLSWQLELKNGKNGTAPTPLEYSAALARLNDTDEVALICLPDLHRDLQEEDARVLLKDLVAQADALRDRLVLIDAPAKGTNAFLGGGHVVQWANTLRDNPPGAAFRAAAIYHPWIEVPDPLGGVINPLRNMPPCGHVAGAISRLDRERGAHHSPANTPLLEATDLAPRPNAEEQLQLNTNAVNLLRCIPGHGLQIWGCSTLARVPVSGAASQPFVADHFIAYRRLIHRLVRAIRRVAEPLVFDTNGPELWLTFVRAVTAVLLEAYRGGALKGARPDEAFRVQCDEKTNPPEERELGRCVCEIAIAPAAPMEFIVLRVALGSAGSLEVFES